MGYLLPFSIGAAVAVFVLASLVGWALQRLTGKRQTITAYVVAGLGGIGLYCIGGDPIKPIEVLIYPAAAILVGAVALWLERRPSRKAG
jgi:hypothetical protein